MPQKVRVSAFTITYPGLSKILTTNVLISKAFDPTPERVKSEEFQTKQYKAIWDTGATDTVVTQKIVDECDLKPIGVIEAHTTKGISKTNLYLVNAWLPNNVIVYNVSAALGQVIGNVEVLIGMNIISMGDFVVTNKGGKTVFSFRFPSVECIDFVKKRFKPKPAKTIPGRKRSTHRKK